MGLTYCYPSDISRWMAGGSPSQERIDEILMELGGSVDRALSGWVPPAVAETMPTVPQIGTF